MGIEISFTGDAELSAQQRAALDAGGLDGEQVWVQYHTQHDAQVRASHAALDGTVWRADDIDAPTPPIDYGCRCYLTYVAKPGTVAARVFPEAEGKPTTKADAYAAYLNQRVPEWREVAKAAAAGPPEKQLSNAFLKLKELRPDLKDTRELARMVVEAAPSELPPSAVPPPTPDPIPPAPAAPPVTPASVLPAPKQAKQIALEGQPLRIPDVPAPMGEPPPAPDVHPAVVAVERQIARRTTERIAVIAPDGRMLAHGEGGEREADVPLERVPGEFRGSVMTHNHPSGQTHPTAIPASWGTSLSPADVAVAIQYEVAAMRAVTPAGLVFEVSPGAKGWPKLATLERELAKAEATVGREMWARIADRTITPSTASALHYHRVWGIVSEALGFRYRWGRLP